FRCFNKRHFAPFIRGKGSIDAQVDAGIGTIFFLDRTKVTLDSSAKPIMDTKLTTPNTST
ncbi:MAG: hypothetical protein IKV48_07455, partial [Eggerthellaceae bacterium]|nr:hypothetical protein [Eggerthellaceae bacterium]